MSVDKTAKKTANQTAEEHGQKGDKATVTSLKQPLPWKIIVNTGALLGVLALLVSLYKPGYTQIASSFAMLFSIYYIQPKVKARRYLSGLLSSTLAGIIAWLGVIVFHPSSLIVNPALPVVSQVLQALATIFLPMWVMLSLGLSWLNLWVVERAEKRREKLEKEKKAERDALRPPKTSSFRKKKKRKKKK